MSDPVQAALDEGRRERTEGHFDNAVQAYANAAQLARSHGDQRLLAHALRHVSDLSRQRGEARSAWEHASEAAALYRQSDDQLGLANAVRLQALSAPGRNQAKACWQEARDLYSSLGVSACVAECDRHLGY